MNRINAIVICFLLPALTYGTSDDNLQLIFANVLWRHGARSPIWIDNQHVWPQGLGQLTQIGMQQQFSLGKYLKQRYGDLLSPMYDRTEIYIRSTDFDRTLMSAECNLAGMYPPMGRQKWNGTNTNWQPVPVHTVPRSEDKLLSFPPDAGSNPKYDAIMQKVWNLPELQKLEVNNKEFLAQIRNFTHFPEELTIKNIHRVRDVYVCDRAQNFSWPGWLTKERFDLMSYISGIQMGALYGAYTQYEKPIARLTTGVLVQKILQNMDDYISNTSSYNVIAYSAHDTTLAALLSAFHIFDRTPPPFASSIMMELYSDTSDGYVVKTFYRTNISEEPLQLRLLGCDQDCPLDELKRLASDLFPPKPTSTTPSVTTSASTPASAAKKSDIYLVVYASIISILFLLTWITLAVKFLCSKRNDTSRRGKYQPVESREATEDDIYLKA